jgi:signal peptidase I
MEPNLKHGDVVLVRKSDFLPNMLRSESLEDATERARILRRDDDTWAAHSWLLHQPPFVLQGDVVVFRSPSTAFPNEYNIKRIIAQGGQLVR